MSAETLGCTSQNSYNEVPKKNEMEIQAICYRSVTDVRK